jgi:cobyrinic acid a,c-diamide synthase
VPALEAREAAATIERAADLVGTHLDVDRLLDLARASALADESAPGIPPLAQRVAIARDDAFCFIYPHLLDEWRRSGVELDFFSPLADQRPGPSADAVYLPGGYPELWAAGLAEAERFLKGLRQAGAEGKPVYGECGGYMVLGQALVDADGLRHPMAGLLPLQTSFAERRLHLGYRSATLLGDAPLGRAGSGFRGHEFHYATVVQEGGADPLWSVSSAAGADLGRCGLRHGSVFGSYIHLIDRAASTNKYGALSGLDLARDLSLPEEVIDDFGNRD